MKPTPDHSNCEIDNNSCNSIIIQLTLTKFKLASNSKIATKNKNYYAKSAQGFFHSLNFSSMPNIVDIRLKITPSNYLKEKDKYKINQKE